MHNDRLFPLQEEVLLQADGEDFESQNERHRLEEELLLWLHDFIGEQIQVLTGLIEPDEFIRVGKQLIQMSEFVEDGNAVEVLLGGLQIPLEEKALAVFVDGDVVRMVDLHELSALLQLEDDLQIVA